MDEADFSAGDIRIIQAMADFQMALSALDFVSEVSPDEPISRIERRRLRCFEDAAVVAYWRPFSYSNGLPKLTLETLGITATTEQLTLHERLKERRNKVIAHTDVDRMRLVLSTFRVSEDSEIMMPQYNFDDALEFYPNLDTLIMWIRILHQAATRAIFKRVQGRREIHFKRDHIDQG
ncbi:hypothetical protein [Acetobacter pasteurianus]|uniref:HEPN AbiU2-like domain-containing protein n=2 Tax=Acetobacter TaxID=434 RepID=A0A0S3JPT7_ACEPA|nr:hypothetical protein [Acetobacter pasteurianus]ALR88418.1 hypothetical protein DB34_14785 [Acetobacter pasteurianus]